MQIVKKEHRGENARLVLRFSLLVLFTIYCGKNCLTDIIGYVMKDSGVCDTSLRFRHHKEHIENTL